MNKLAILESCIYKLYYLKMQAYSKAQITDGRHKEDLMKVDSELQDVIKQLNELKVNL